MDKMLPRSKWHVSVTAERAMADVARRMRTLDNPGICLECGAESGECEPDARNYPCELCGAKQVFGSEEIAMVMDVM